MGNTTRSSEKIEKPVIGQEKADTLARQIVRQVESALYYEFDPAIKDHVIPQLIGIFKNVYQRQDTTGTVLSHTGIERTILNKKFEEAERGLRK